MNRCFLLLSLLFVIGAALAQPLEVQLEAVTKRLTDLNRQEKAALEQLEDLKLARIRRDLKAVALPALSPGDELIEHSAMYLVYSEKNEVAKWVAHIITPDVLSGTVSRTNDFRTDPMIKTGSSVEADYFLTKWKADSTLEYDGFGFDRGHLAPSADFRWSQKALSESYFYSNMSPQLPAFNREIWSHLEDRIRGYLYDHPTSQLYVITGPVLSENLPVIERGVNKVTIPALFWKAAVDLENKKAIGFIIPNRGSKEPLESFAVSIDKIETLTGLNLFAALPDSIAKLLEARVDTQAFLPKAIVGNVNPIDALSLPRNHVNSRQAESFKNQKYTVNVCGRVVSSRLSRAGNVLLNLDQQFPNQVFTVFIKREDIINFSYDPVKALLGQTICVKGKVIELGDVPGMYVTNDKAVKFFEEQD